jgi:diguanylate cyclase (GGDEF)-like protein
MIVLLLTLTMSVRLFASRRRKAYFSLTVSIITFLIQYVLLIAYAFDSGSLSGKAGSYAQLVQVIAFILINRAILQLYNSTKKRHHLYFYSALFITVLLGLFRLSVPGLFSGPAEQIRALEQVGLDLFLLALLFVCFMAIPPYIRQDRKYQFGLMVYFVFHLSHLINLYMLDKPHPVFAFAELYVPLLYFFVLFLLLFDRIVELMQASFLTAITDGLTGLYNRKYILNAISRYLQSGYSVSAMFSDIDNFKMLNDTQGHQAGDDALRAVAGIIREECEEIGIAGRFGGEEIVAVLFDHSADISAFAEKVRSRVERETGVTVSIGTAKSRKGMTADELIAQADKAMYIAKTTGKNKVVKYTGKKDPGQTRGAASKDRQGTVES